MDLSKHTAAELHAIIMDVEQIDPDRPGYLTQYGEYISHELFVAASRRLQSAIQRERGAKGGRGRDSKEAMRVVEAITLLLISGARPPSIPDMCRDSGVGDVLERRSTTTIKRWLIRTPIWEMLDDNYINQLKRPGRRRN